MGEYNAQRSYVIFIYWTYEQVDNFEKPYVMDSILDVRNHGVISSYTEKIV